MGGHQRIKALLAMGETEAQVLVVDLPATEEKALNITMNNPAIEGDFTLDVDALLEEIKVDFTEEDFGGLRLEELGKEILEPLPEKEIIEADLARKTATRPDGSPGAMGLARNRIHERAVRQARKGEGQRRCTKLRRCRCRN